ncbi:MAG: hypothetical protein KF795_22820 [Labilithrix sp.]|nr:hypothetical protein [Labilithrix sp.]
MPTLSQIKLPVPKSWDEFEAIVCSAVAAQNPFTPPTRYGRTGQAQHGVDIFFEDSLTRAVGIQCKCVESITYSDVLAEVAKAESFSPALESYVIAIALPRDAKLQKQVFQLSHARAAAQKFRVGLWFWDDIASDLAKDAAALALHFPHLFSSVGGPPAAAETVADLVVKERFAAYRELWTYLQVRLLPQRRHPDYDWDDALEDIALELSTHWKQLDGFHKRLGPVLPKDVADALGSATTAAQDGMFEIDLSDNASVPDTATQAAEKVYESVVRAVDGLRDHLEDSGLRFGSK